LNKFFALGFPVFALLIFCGCVTIEQEPGWEQYLDPVSSAPTDCLYLRDEPMCKCEKVFGTGIQINNETDLNTAIQAYADSIKGTGNPITSIKGPVLFDENIWHGIMHLRNIDGTYFWVIDSTKLFDRNEWVAVVDYNNHTGDTNWVWTAIKKNEGYSFFVGKNGGIYLIEWCYEI